VILAYGELTGHAHAVIGDAELFESDVSEIGQRFLRVEQESEVVHEEHGTVTLPPGDYEIRRQHEYSPEAIRTRQALKLPDRRGDAFPPPSVQPTMRSPA
jgi:hypothetical protein